MNNPKNAIEKSGSIDAKALDTIRSFSPENPTKFLHETIKMFLDDSARQLSNLRDAIRSGDTSVMQRIAHSLKSVSASIGALALSSLFKEMENMGLTNATGNAEYLIQKINSEYKEVEKALTDELHGRAS